MSPEQAEFNADDIDTRTDIYALGCRFTSCSRAKLFDAKEPCLRSTRCVNDPRD